MLWALLALAAVCWLPGTSHAQEEVELELEAPRPRQGYYVGLGLHGVTQQLWNRGESAGVGAGFGGSLRFGQMVTSRFGLGLNLSMAALQTDDMEVSLFGIGLEGQYEIATNLSVFGGVSLGVLTFSDEGDDDLDGSFGANYFVGLGYDWFLGKKDGTGGWALTPMVQVHFLPGERSTSLSAFIGVQITYWTGLPCNQLDLPEDAAYGE